MNGIGFNVVHWVKGTDGNTTQEVAASVCIMH